MKKSYAYMTAGRYHVVPFTSKAKARKMGNFWIKKGVPEHSIHLSRQNNVHLLLVPKSIVKRFQRK